MEDKIPVAADGSGGTSPMRDRGCTCIEALESVSKSDTDGDPNDEFVTYLIGQDGLACDEKQTSKWYCSRLPSSSAEFMQKQCEDIVDENGREYTVSALVNDLMLYMVTNPSRWSEFMESCFTSPENIEDAADTTVNDTGDATDEK